MIPNVVLFKIVTAFSFFHSGLFMNEVLDFKDLPKKLVETLIAS